LPVNVLALVPRIDLLCGWCGVEPGRQHDRECPSREDGPDFPAYCGRCGATYTTVCNCEVEQ
jgi:hypothetical protein